MRTASFLGALGAALGLLSACAPAPTAYPVQVFEGQATVLFRPQLYRLTLTVHPQTHEVRGVMDNRSSGDRFEASGTLLPTPDGSEELTLRLSSGATSSLRFSVFGFGIDGITAKSDALLSGTVKADLLSGQLRVGVLSVPLSLRRVTGAGRP